MALLPGRRARRLCGGHHRRVGRRGRGPAVRRRRPAVVVCPRPDPAVTATAAAAAAAVLLLSSIPSGRRPRRQRWRLAPHWRAPPRPRPLDRPAGLTAAVHLHWQHRHPLQQRQQRRRQPHAVARAKVPRVCASSVLNSGKALQTGGCYLMAVCTDGQIRAIQPRLSLRRCPRTPNIIEQF